MKKILSILAIALVFCMNTRADNKQVITFMQLPQAAQDAISANFKASDVSYVTKESGWSTEYEVRLNDGTEIEFDGDGAVKEVDCKKNAVPEALLPADVVSYVKTHFAGVSITKWGQDDGSYEAELSNGLELKFDKSYRFLRLGD